MSLPKHYNPRDHGERDRPFHHDTPPFRLQYLIAFLPSRFLRSGPRTIVHFTACFAFLILLVKMMTLSASSLVVLNKTESASKTWLWTTEVEVSNGAGKHESHSGKGLRIVVFGQDDAATPGRMSTLNGARMPSWTDVMCDELNCDTLLSFIPLSSSQSPTSHALTSNALYLSAIETALNRTSTSEDYPSDDYTFQPKLFPIPRNIPDLSRQIDYFLSLNDNTGTPTRSETIYIITLGPSDIFHLATLPLSISKQTINTLISLILTQTERLYSNTSSPKEAFRVLIPLLLDPSILPGWATSRPTTSAITAEAQLRNAAALTTHWNNILTDQLNAWVLQPQLTTTTAWDNTSNNNINTKNTAATQTESTDTRPARRDAFLFDFADYVLDIMRDRKSLRTQGLDDKIGMTGTGGGGGVRGGRFEDVRGTCLARVPGNKKDYGEKKGKKETKTCKDPDEYLFWDGSKLGPRAIRGLGRWAAEIFRNGKTVRAEFGSGGP
ncbi:hypothetical protein QBC44DRAFT_82942 [Cladorrhinum sp. PSN332]|nr:hypothetical protein QBC44DRAFT_82942 [Cladorrhinum sp. PSN332]